MGGIWMIGRGRSVFDESGLWGGGVCWLVWYGGGDGLWSWVLGSWCGCRCMVWGFRGFVVARILLRRDMVSASWWGGWAIVNSSVVEQ